MTKKGKNPLKAGPGQLRHAHALCHGPAPLSPPPARARSRELQDLERRATATRMHVVLVCLAPIEYLGRREHGLHAALPALWAHRSVYWQANSMSAMTSMLSSLVDTLRELRGA